MDEQNLLASVLTLSEDARVRLVQKLLESLSPQTDTWDEDAFAAEVQRRSAEIDGGTAELILWEQLKNEPI
jgi:putative addiction module component (TIGR02574 family)